MTQLLTNIVPDRSEPYVLRAGHGQRYLFGMQLATIMATLDSTDGRFELVQLSGGKGDGSPLTSTVRRTKEYLFLIGNWSCS